MIYLLSYGGSVADLNTLSGRLRSEIGDTPRSFIDTFTGDGTTTRYQLSQAPVQGATLTVKVAEPTSTWGVTGALAAAGRITYTSNNRFVVGQIVTVTGLSTAAFNITGAVATATPTAFTIVSSATGATVTNSSTGSATGFPATTDISAQVIIEEGVGVLTIPTLNTPLNGSVITVSGQAYRYFTDSEIAYYFNTAFAQHTKGETTSLGSRITQLAFLPPVEEYPLVLLASTLALYTLANDAAFDIDIISPDGVSIPRTERYRQLMEMVQTRKDQYRELCTMLGIGLYRIEVFSLRRISRLTNRYIPIYRPQEVDDWSLPQRVMLRTPTYGDETPESPILVQDLEMYSGDDFLQEFGFSFDLTNYTAASEIVLYQNSEFSQVGPVVLGTFGVSKVTPLGGVYPTLIALTLPGSVTERLPKVSYYDLVLTDGAGKKKTYFGGKVYTFPSVTNSYNRGVV
jgi:hypothetical protein